MTITILPDESDHLRELERAVVEAACADRLWLLTSQVTPNMMTNEYVDESIRLYRELIIATDALLDARAHHAAKYSPPAPAERVMEMNR